MQKPVEIGVELVSENRRTHCYIFESHAVLTINFNLKWIRTIQMQIYNSEKAFIKTSPVEIFRPSIDFCDNNGWVIWIKIYY